MVLTLFVLAANQKQKQPPEKPKTNDHRTNIYSQTLEQQTTLATICFLCPTKSSAFDITCVCLWCTFFLLAFFPFVKEHKVWVDKTAVIEKACLAIERAC